MNSTRKTIVVHIILLFLTFLTEAQKLEITYESMPFEEVPGLIVGMDQDKDGNIWLVSSLNGLFKYDGTNLKNWREGIKYGNSLVTNRLECIEIAKDGIIWMGSFSDGLIRFDPKTEDFKQFKHDPKVPNSIRTNSIRALLSEDDKGIWIGTASGLDFFEFKSQSFIHSFSGNADEKYLSEEHIRSLYLDNSKILWIGCGSPFFGEETTGGLFKLDQRTKEVKRYIHGTEKNTLINNQIRAIYEDSRGIFWVGTSGDGLHTMNRDDGTFIRYRYDASRKNKLSRSPVKNVLNYANDHITFINEDLDGFIYIGTFMNGFSRYDPKRDQIQHYGLEELKGLNTPNNYLWNCLRTEDGLLWIAMWVSQNPGSQLLRINPVSRKIHSTILNQFIYSFNEDQNHNLYVGARAELIRIDSAGNTKALLAFPDQYNNIPNNGMKQIEKDSQENFWISSSYGLHYYNLKTGSLKSYTTEKIKGLKSNNIQCTHFLNKDSLLVGTDESLYLFELKNSRFTSIPFLDSLRTQPTPLNIQKILIDKQNRIWISTMNRGLKQLDIYTRTYRTYFHSASISSEGVYDMILDVSGNLLVSTRRNGLNKYDKQRESFIKIRDKTGLILPSTQIYSIGSDSDSTLWLEIKGGVLRFNRNSGKTALFGSNWGFNSSQTTHNGFFKTSKNVFFKGTNFGYVSFSEDYFKKKNGYTPSPFVANLLINNVVFQDEFKENLKLIHTQNNIKLELGYINYLTAGNANKLQYKLVGYEQNWRNGENAELVNYYKLSPNDYVFEMRAMDIYGEWTYYSLPISIAPPWYNTWWAYLLFALLAIGLLRVYIIFRARKLIAENRALEVKISERTLDLKNAKEEVEKSLDQLKSTQAQLIQSEKMASLGELTAGIAHEIQNPLNFVNNFSEVSTEMIDELDEELEKGDLEEVKAISSDLKQNLSKINHHGQRASSIVKGMLEHSRKSSGKKELTDINALADEYLRLAYRGLRAKDSAFQSDFETYFDSNLPKIEVVPQDIGRVLLNLINNGFQAVDEQAKKGIEGYKPTLVVSTKAENGQVLISVQDNGPGIPEAIKDKIFQPFFTTKDTGKGTGLGLSLAYDIVKAHDGELSVKSNASDGVSFIIQLPLV